MKVERLDVKSCCGKTSLAFKIDSPLSKNILSLLIGKGFIEGKNFTTAGMLYAENDAIIVSGTFGQDIIHVKCKINDCTNSVNNFEQLVANTE